MIKFIDEDHDKGLRLGKFKFYLRRVKEGMGLEGGEAVAAAWWLYLKEMCKHLPESYTTDGNTILCTTVDREWYNSLEKFVSDLGCPRVKGAALILPLRINPSLGYVQNNVVWGNQRKGEGEHDAALRVLRQVEYEAAEQALKKEAKLERERIKSEAKAKAKQALAMRQEALKKVRTLGPKLSFSEFLQGRRND